eukprot:GHVR01006406.1.p1 GENE.GHVR01006406.1~~GHVR01006406.1.p1  ORF type:complete len:127 (+),score=0.84 GHVR01006406.1:600-980(+)
MKVNKIYMLLTDNNHGLQLILNNGIEEVALDVAGTGPFNKEYDVPDNDEIKCIRFGVCNSGAYYVFTSFEFLLKSGNRSPIYSGSWQAVRYDEIWVNPEKNEHFIGIFGSYVNSNSITSLGLVTMN